METVAASEQVRGFEAACSVTHAAPHQPRCISGVWRARDVSARNPLLEAVPDLLRAAGRAAAASGDVCPSFTSFSP